MIQTLPKTFETLWFDYFDLGRDYAALRRACICDSYSRQAAAYGQGIRILRQDRWEALCSFIISQCNNIPRIKAIIETLCRTFGEPVSFEGEILYSFPSAQTLAGLTPDALAPLRCGYRAPYILEAARAVCDGRLDLDALACGSYAQALSALKQVRGIGDKVANCVILFGLQIPNAFPIDTWIRKVLDTHYEKGFDPASFGDAAGLVQQYLFYYARSGNV